MRLSLTSAGRLALAATETEMAEHLTHLLTRGDDPELACARLAELGHAVERAGAERLAEGRG